MDELQKRIPPLTGPLLPLLPPKPLNRRLPRLPPRPATSPSQTAIAPGWTCETLVLPASFPRMFPNNTKWPNEPSRDPTAAGGKKSDVNAGFDRLVREQLEAFTHPVSLDDRDELDKQEQLVIVGNRYRPPPPRRTAASSSSSGPGLTLVLSHANGFYKGESLHSFVLSAWT